MIITYSCFDNVPLARFKLSLEETKVLNKAVRQYKNLTFDKLKKKYKNLSSTKEFLTDSKYLGNIKIIIYSSKKDSITPIQYFLAVKNVLNRVSTLIVQKEDTYIGTKEFKAKKLKDIITDKKIKVTIKENDRHNLMKQ